MPVLLCPVRAVRRCCLSFAVLSGCMRMVCWSVRNFRLRASVKPNWACQAGFATGQLCGRADELAAISLGVAVWCRSTLCGRGVVWRRRVRCHTSPFSALAGGATYAPLFCFPLPVLAALVCCSLPLPCAQRGRRVGNVRAAQQRRQGKLLIQAQTCEGAAVRRAAQLSAPALVAQRTSARVSALALAAQRGAAQRSAGC